MIKEYPLKLRQVCLFIITIMPVLKLFWYPSIVCANAQEDAWIATLFSGILDILSITLILLVCHNTEKDIYTFLEDGFGKIGSKIILFLYLIYFLIKVTLPLIEQKGYVKLTLYEMMPNIISFTPFFIASVYLCMQRVRTL